MEKSIFDAICLPLWFIGFALAYMFVVTIVSQAGGWSKLAEHYKIKGYHQAKWQWFKYLGLNFGMNYSGSALIGYADDGLALDVLFLFKYQHPRLFIPKSEIKYKGSVKYPWWEYEAFEFVSCPTVVMRLLKKDGEELKKRFGLETFQGEVMR